MLTTYFKRQTTQATYYSGPAGPYLDEFTNWPSNTIAVIECQIGVAR